MPSKHDAEDMATDDEVRHVVVVVVMGTKAATAVKVNKRLARARRRFFMVLQLWREYVGLARGLFVGSVFVGAVLWFSYKRSRRVELLVFVRSDDGCGAEVADDMVHHDGNE